MFKYEVKTKQGYLLTRKSKKVYTHCGVVSIGDRIAETTYASSYNTALSRARSTAKMLTNFSGKKYVVDVYTVSVK